MASVTRLQPADLPTAANVGLLVLRVWTGLTMLLWHGWPRLANFYQAAQGFPDVLHVGSPALNLALSLSAEALCAALLAVGLFTRAAAIPLVVNMAVAFALVHGLQLSGDGSGELAFIYLGAFVTVLATGPGRYSLDAVLFTWPLRRSTPDAAQSDSWPGSPTASPAPVSRR